MESSSTGGLTFRRQRTDRSASVSPEALFGDLPKLPTRVAPLWGHQTDQLRTYFEKHRATADVALELPTGSGKTLVGMLIAEWRRTSLRQRTVYACPTVQLAEQAAEKANHQGISVSLLTGGAPSWEPRLLHAYERGERIAVTTYSSIFNSYPKINDAGTIVLDDAHAAEDYVAKAWSISIKKGETLYDDIVEALRSSLDSHFVARLTTGVPEAATEADVRLIPPTIIVQHEGELEAVLSGGLRDNRKHAFSMVSGQLAACSFYVSGKSILIRPMVPPTISHPAFHDAAQRVYLSATLGGAGELERAFGRTKMSRIPVPEEWNRSGGGRRFFIFPELADRTNEPDLTVGQLTQNIINQAEKQVILAQSEAMVAGIADAFEIPEATRFSVGSSSSGRAFKDFALTGKGALLAANRYDGMDLKDGTCRMLLIDGLPSVMNEQDRFLLSRVHAGEVLAQRLRTRIIQGVGRCTRGPKDYSVVVVTGQELTSFLSKDENLEPLPVEVQAEIRFGWQISQLPAKQLPQLASSALNQDILWQTEAEPEIVAERAECTTLQPAAEAILEKSAPHEVTAWRAVWRRDWQAAVMHANEVCSILDSGQLRAYRALWSFLTAEFIAIAGAKPGSAEDLRRTELLRDARALTSRATWLREIAPETGGIYDPNQLDLEAATNVCSLAKTTLQSKTKSDKRVAGMLEGLAAQKSEKYEAALISLGELVGATRSFKPTLKGRTDAVWLWDSLWITVEAKSEQKSNGLLSMDYVRQANTQLKSLAADLDTECPEDSVTVVVSPRQVVDNDSATIAEGHLYLAEPREIMALGLDVKRAWIQLRSMSFSAPSASHTAAGILWQHRLLPEQIRERLTSDPIH